MSAQPLAKLASLPSATATEVKNGWRGVMQSVQKSGAVVLTHHEQPQAVIVSYDAYKALVAAAEANSQQALDGLRARFDQRLAALNAPDAAHRLAAVATRPAKLQGKVKAGRKF